MPEPRPYAMRPFEASPARPKSFDETIDRLMALEKRETEKAGRPSSLRQDFEMAIAFFNAQIDMIVAILREKGVITHEHKRLFERYAGEERAADGAGEAGADGGGAGGD